MFFGLALSARLTSGQADGYPLLSLPHACSVVEACLMRLAVYTPSSF